MLAVFSKRAQRYKQVPGTSFGGAKSLFMILPRPPLLTSDANHTWWGGDLGNPRISRSTVSTEPRVAEAAVEALGYRWAPTQLSDHFPKNKYNVCTKHASTVVPSYPKSTRGIHFGGVCVNGTLPTQSVYEYIRANSL